MSNKSVTEVVESLNKTPKGGLICRFCRENAQNITMKARMGDQQCKILLDSFLELVKGEIKESDFLKMINVPKDDVIDIEYVDNSEKS